MEQAFLLYADRLFIRAGREKTPPWPAAFAQDD